MNKISKTFRATTSLSTIILVAVMLGACATPIASPSPAATSPQSANTPMATSGILSTGSNVLSALDASLENIYSQVYPSVVNIYAILSASSTGSSSEVSGSGFVWDEQGHIVTNNHVIDGARKIEVTFSDGVTVTANVVGADPDSDLAVLQIDQSKVQLHPVSMAAVGDVRVGQLAIAIGSPFGLEGSMSMGVVSALGRTLPAGSQSTLSPTYSIPDIIQTDAPINPGNSGGVLVNDQGQVIGVTSAIISPVDASSGVGFAIPAEIILKVVPALIKDGYVAHTYIGITGTSLDPDLAQAMGLPEEQLGALVVTVTPNGPADKAGIHGSNRTTTINGQDVPVGGDVIVGVDGQSIKSFDDLVSYLYLKTDVGQSVTFDILRNGQSEQIKVTLEARPSLSALSIPTTNPSD
jgi:serine protease Do